MSRLAIEIKAGVFVATINARVRDELWKRITEEWKNPSIMLFSTNNEQGYGIRTFGNPEREVIDFEGISLLCKPAGRSKNEPEEEIDSADCV